ncbi:drug resistance transporter [Magnaporthiopsis poae ATCC 64411]|uniref:Drug resistance transporter n=1 Tax=Magnaporthiopsis poae (strain ATCC 64411 / 73-15) TaxID=644358 RepID=A0A0C4DR77_MAGP6|nr:drug resistance transporter [Magnaporthiopsis poae ATCC 64411]
MSSPTVKRSSLLLQSPFPLPNLPEAHVPLRHSSIGIPPRRSSLGHGLSANRLSANRLSLHRRSLRRSDSMEEALRPSPSSESESSDNGFGGGETTIPTPDTEELGRGRCAAVVIMLLTCLLFSLLDTTIVSTSLLDTAQDLGNFSDSTWIILSYLLTYMGFSVIFAKLSDIFGRLAILEVSWLLFTFFSLGCGLAQTMNQLIIMRAFQGIGGAGLYSLPIICLHEIIPRPKWQIIGGVIALTLSISYVLGPSLGGIIPHLSSWRLLYLINIPFGAVVAIGLFLLYPRGPQQNSATILQSFRMIDLLGAVLLLAASMMLVYPIQEAGSMKYPWDSAPIVVALTLSALSWIAFWCWEALLHARGGRVAPVFPISLATHRVYVACLFVTILVGFVFMPAIITIPERSQILEGKNVMMAGVDLLPMLAAVAVGSFAAGPLSIRKNRSTLSLILGASLVTIGACLMTILESMPAGSATKAMYGFEAILGLGFGLCLSSTTIMANLQARGADMAVANGAVAQARVLGSAIGLGVWTIIFNTRTQSGGRLRSAAQGGILTAEQAATLHRMPTSMLQLPEPARTEATAVYKAAFSNEMVVLAIASAVAFALSFCTYEANPLPAQTPPSSPPSSLNPKQMMADVDGTNDHELVDMPRIDVELGTFSDDYGQPLGSTSRRESVELTRLPTVPLPIITR